VQLRNAPTFVAIIQRKKTDEVDNFVATGSPVTRASGSSTRTEGNRECGYESANQEKAEIAVGDLVAIPKSRHRGVKTGLSKT
jgi:hypothetical protein